MRIDDLLKTLKREYQKICLLQSLIDTIIVFLVLNLPFLVFGVFEVYGFAHWKFLTVLAAFFFVLDSYWRFKQYDVTIYEDENPELKELLRTAKDNTDKTNTVSQALFDQIQDITRNMSSEAIVPTREILGKIVFIGVMSIMTISAGAFDLSSTDISDTLDFEDETNEIFDADYDGDHFIEDGHEDVLGDPEDIESGELLIDIETESSGDEQVLEVLAESNEQIVLESSENDFNRELALDYMEGIQDIE